MIPRQFATPPKKSLPTGNFRYKRYETKSSMNDNTQYKKAYTTELTEQDEVKLRAKNSISPFSPVESRFPSIGPRSRIESLNIRSRPGTSSKLMKKVSFIEEKGVSSHNTSQLELLRASIKTNDIL